MKINHSIQKLLRYHKIWKNVLLSKLCNGCYLMQTYFPVTDFEMQMIKLDESAEQLKEATEVTFSVRNSCKIICF